MKGVVILWTKDAHETKSYVRTQHSFTLYPGRFFVHLFARYVMNNVSEHVSALIILQWTKWSVNIIKSVWTKYEPPCVHQSCVHFWINL